MFIYTLAIKLYAAIIALVAPWNKKAKQWRDGRKGLIERMAKSINPNERIVWVHCSSLGEFEQGRPIIEELHKHNDKVKVKILLTFFSPSGYEIRKNYPGADYIFYLPLDTPRNARKILDIVNPEFVIFVKYEYWLNLLSELRRRTIPHYIVSAIFRQNSIFFKWYGGYWREALNGFDTIFVQNNESKQLLSIIGTDNCSVAGDTRFDRVADIARAAKKIDIIERFKGKNRLFVAGSTWGADEQLLQQLINNNPDIKFVIAPHEMEEQRIDKILKESRGGAVRYTRCEDSTPLADSQVLVLDTVGLLSSVYGYAEWAYIGGGFGVGIHNTLEAATFGLPIAFGPNYHKFKEARDMISLQGAKSITNYEELEQWFLPLKNDEQLLKATSRITRDYTAKNQGATSIILRSIFSK